MPRQVILVLSAVAALLLGLEKVGVFHFLPAGDVAFTSSAQRLPDGRSALVLRTDAGDLSCWLRVVVRWQGSNSGDWEASIDSGEPLVLAVVNAGAGRREISISRGPNRSERTPFTWRAGLPVRVAWTGPTAGPLFLEDWSIHPATQPSDSREKAARRTLWTRISWVLLTLSLIGAAATAWPQPRPPLLASGVTLVRAIAATVEGDDPEQTKQLRAFLAKVLLEGVPVAEALDALRIPRTPFRARPVLVAKARRVFLDRITTVQDELDSYADRLNVP